jgi:hypothetical protein
MDLLHAPCKVAFRQSARVYAICRIADYSIRQFGSRIRDTSIRIRKTIVLEVGHDSIRDSIGLSIPKSYEGTSGFSCSCERPL